MQEFDIKRGHYKNLENDGLKNVMTDVFGDVNMDGEKFLANYGAMKPITVWLKSKKEICVDISTDTTVDDETAMKTIRARNDFLLKATGFTTKERKKRLNKKAKDGSL